MTDNADCLATVSQMSMSDKSMLMIGERSCDHTTYSLFFGSPYRGYYTPAGLSLFGKVGGFNPCPVKDEMDDHTHHHRYPEDGVHDSECIVGQQVGRDEARNPATSNE
jgi:hypothetical protein